MPGSYDFEKIEKRWREVWYKNNIYEAKDFSKKTKKYILAEFPYPSGTALHAGHMMRYTMPDVFARYFRMKGYNVLFPMGWDAFGLPAEDFAIRTGIHPEDTTKEAIENYKTSMLKMGYGIDWTREVNTTDPKYYKWTQWLFLKFWEEGLAEYQEMPVWWCEELKTVLADEEVLADENGNKVSERRGFPVERKMLKQWVLKIPKYAEKLLEGLNQIDFPEAIKSAQSNWIGKSEGALIKFQVENTTLEVFTTRPDTLFGVTFVALAPEHELLKTLLAKVKNAKEVTEYIETVSTKSELERQVNKEKTGVELEGIKAKHPFTNTELPIFVADYVLPKIGTGAIMGVPAHDERDFEFAKKFNLEIKVVIEPITGTKRENEEFRKSIVALVINPKNNKVLSINWGSEFGGSLLIGGGLKDSEDVVECAKREVREETGYVNLKYIKTSETIHHHYFAYSKEVPRQIEVKGLLFELIDEERQKPKLENDELNKFKAEWLDVRETQLKIVDSLHRYILEKFLLDRIYTGDGILTNSEEFSQLDSKTATEKIIQKLESQNKGTEKVTYKIRAWVFSRQRYWGEPIPLIHKKTGEVEAICDTKNPKEVKDTLPLVLPNVPDYRPTSDGTSPLARNKKWVKTTANDGTPAERETSTMPNWAGSCWYYMRYIDPQNETAFADYEKLKYWLPVDNYFGGAEHTTLHLLYSRFWHKFFYDLKLVPTPEPYNWRMNGGILLGPDGRKMSKSKGNVIEPMDIVENYGADALRTYICFLGPYTDTYPWSDTGIKSTWRLMKNIYALKTRISDTPQDIEITRAYHKMVKKVTNMIVNLKMNTAISEIMIFVNKARRTKHINIEVWKGFVKVIAPFAPFLAEELWQGVNNYKKWSKENSVHLQPWPNYSEDLARDEIIIIPVQINGKARGEIEIEEDEQEEFVIKKAKEFIKDEKIKKVIYVPNKIINLVVK